VLCLRWHRISGGHATGPGRTQDLSATMQAVRWQGSHNAGLGAPGAAIFAGAGAGPIRKALATCDEARGFR
jgi:hypothetical protein